MSSSPNALKITRDLLAFDTINSPGNEKPCAEYLGKMLEEAGFDITDASALTPGMGNPPTIILGREKLPWPIRQMNIVWFRELMKR